MSRYTNEELENMLSAVIDELNLSDFMLEKHGPMGTPVHEIVREVLENKDREIYLLKQKFAVLHLD